MPRLRLRTRILLVFSALAAALTVAMLALVSLQASRFVDRRLVSDLEDSRRLLVDQEQARLVGLENRARLLASFPDLKALLVETDAATIRDFLLDYRSSIGPAALLALLDPRGAVIARTDAVSAPPIADAETRWVQPALTDGAARGTLAIGEQVFHAAAVPVEVGGTIFGFLLAGSPVDDRYAQELRQIGRDEVVLLGHKGVLASTLLRDRLPWADIAGFRERHGTAAGPLEVLITGERYTALTVPTVPGAEVLALSLQSRDQALAPYRLIQAGLLVLGLVAIVTGIAGSAMLARSITQPVSRLAEGTRQVASGNYDVTIAIDRSDELGELAASFNQMTNGLRERAAMQKFVSHSTVEMIQARGRPASTGERRRIAALFSDVRGFTALSERLTPDEAVRLLNRCLSVQAELVAKYRGDVDKFIGDAVFAHFSGEDMVLNAIRCAVEIHHAMARLAAGAPDTALELGIGIASGEVILGSIGSADRLDYTALGSTVNLCARLCSVADRREILLSEPAFAAVRDIIAAEPLEPLAVKGFAAPVRAYRMVVREAAQI